MMCNRKLIKFLLILSFCALTLLPVVSRSADAGCHQEFAPSSRYYTWGGEISYPTGISCELYDYNWNLRGTCYHPGNWCGNYNWLPAGNCYVCCNYASFTSWCY